MIRLPISIVALLMLSFGAMAQSLGPVNRSQMVMDDGTYITVDNASHIPNGVVQSLVLASDRGTKTGCPYNMAKKGLFKSGDRLFVSDYYLAWFDYTLEDGVGAGTWSRSGSLAGFWSLDPSTQSFRYFYGRDEPGNGICWNWARNELTPGSSSSNGQAYWWDKYAPSLENTIVIPLDYSGSSWDFFSTNYTQSNSGSGFQVVYDGYQDGGNNVHYVTAGLMTSWRGGNQFVNFTNGQTGTVPYSVQYIAGLKDIRVVWRFQPGISLPVNNFYVGMWTGYTGQMANICGSSNLPLPSGVLGEEIWKYTSYGVPGNMTGSKAFPFSQAVPCSGVNVQEGYSGGPGAVLPYRTTLNVGQDSGFSFFKRRLQLTNLTVPVGDGSYYNAFGVGFDRIVHNYENYDQQWGVYITRGPYSKWWEWLNLQGGSWYQVHYAFSTSFD